jgi:hypothetical protein
MFCIMAARYPQVLHDVSGHAMKHASRMRHFCLAGDMGALMGCQHILHWTSAVWSSSSGACGSHSGSGSATNNATHAVHSHITDTTNTP